MRILFWLFILASSLGRAEEFLDPTVAFKPTVRALDNHSIEVRFDIAKGYYLYRDKFRFAVDAAGTRLGEPRFPKGEIRNDEFFGTEEVYFDHAIVVLPVERSGNAKSLALNIVLQGCAQAGFCYPPQPYRLDVAFPSGTGTNPTAHLALVSNVAADEALATTDVDESGRIAQSLGHSGLPANLLFFFLAGLGLSLTPCVFPMIPILSGIIVGHGKQVSRARGLALSVAYVLGMATTYAAAGVGAGLTGTLISASLQNPWVLGGFAMIFVALSLSMFGLYDLQMPSAIQTWLSNGASHIKGGRSGGVFLIGALSALIVGPCVAAPLAGALLYIGQTGDAMLGGLALFIMALGMGVPLLLVGLSAGTLLPKSGAWMEHVKKFFGVVLLATAVQLVSPVIPVAIQMIAWAILLIVPAMYLHAIDPLPADANGWRRLSKGGGIVMLIVGAALLIGVLSGNRDPLQPLAGLQSPQPSATTPRAEGLAFERVRSLEDLQTRIRSSVRPVMLDFYADWCAACKEMEQLTFSDPVVRTKLAGYQLLQADVTGNTADDQALLRQFGLFGPPGVLFFAGGSVAMPHKRIVGFQDSPRFLQSIASLD